MSAHLMDPDNPRCSDADARGEGKYDGDPRCPVCGNEDCTAPDCRELAEAEARAALATSLHRHWQDRWGQGWRE